MVEVLHFAILFFSFREKSQIQYKRFFYFAGFSLRAGYEAATAALNNACCSLGSAATAAWNSVGWLWANSLLSMANVFWDSVAGGERNTEGESSGGDRENAEDR